MLGSQLPPLFFFLFIIPVFFCEIIVSPVFFNSVFTYKQFITDITLDSFVHYLLRFCARIANFAGVYPPIVLLMPMITSLLFTVIFGFFFQALPFFLLSFPMRYLPCVLRCINLIHLIASHYSPSTPNFTLIWAEVKFHPLLFLY